MYFNFKNPLFQKHDVTALNAQLKDAIQNCIDGANPQNMTTLSRSFDVLTYSMIEPTFMDEIIRNAQPPLLTQVEMMMVRMNKWPNGEHKDMIMNSVRNFLKTLFLETPKILKPYVSKQKPPSYMGEGPAQMPNILQYVGDSGYFIEAPYVESFTTLLRVLRIALLHFDKVQSDKSEQTPPYMSDQGQLEKVIQTLIQVLNIPDYNQENQVRVLDILIFLQRDSLQWKQTIIEQGSLRIFMSKCGENTVGLEVAMRTLLLVRDLCQGNWVTTDLISRYETEKHLMKLLQRFRLEPEIPQLVSSILDLLIKGYDLDSDNLEKNLRSALERIRKYLLQQPDELEPNKVLQSVEILRFYSLMTFYITKIIDLGFLDNLIQLLEKEQQLPLAKLQDQDHIILLIVINMVLAVLIPQAKLNDQSVQKVSQLLSQGIQTVNKIVITTKQPTNQRSLFSDCVQTYLNVLQVLMVSEGTKSMAPYISKTLNASILECKGVWEENRDIRKNVNDQLFLIAKHSNESDKIIGKLVFNDLNQTKIEQTQQTTKVADVQNKKSNLEVIETLSDLPQVITQIVSSQEGVQSILNLMKQETRQLLRMFPIYAQEVVDERIYQVDFGFRDAPDAQEALIQKSENPEEIRAILLEKRKILTRTMQVLRKLFKNAQFKKSEISEQTLIEVLSFMRIYSKERDLSILGLRILNQVAGDERFIAVLQENKGVESIFCVLNDHPTDRDIWDLAGNVLKKLGAEDISKSVKEQYGDLAKQFDPNDQESTTAILQANIYLSNLLSAVPDNEDLEENKRVIDCLSRFLQKGLPREVLGSVLLLICRFAQQGDETKRLLRYSDIPKKIISIVFLDKSFYLDRVTGFAVEAISNMIGGVSEMVNALDTVEGCEYEQETPEIKMEYLDPLQKPMSDPQVLNFLMNLLNMKVLGVQHLLKGAAALKNQDVSLDTLYDSSTLKGVVALELIEKSSQLCGILINDDPSFVARLSQSAKYALEITRELSEPHLTKLVKAQSFQRCGYLLSQLGRCDPQVFLQISLEEGFMSSLVELLDINVDDSFVNSIQQLEQLQSVLKFLQVFLNNKFDKALISKRQIPQRIVKLTRSFFEYFTANFNTAKEDAFFGIVFRDLLQVQYLILMDPIMFKEDKPENYLFSLKKFLDITATLPPRKTEAEDSEEVYGSEDPFIRIVESVYKVLEAATNEIQVCQLYNSQFSEDDVVQKIALQSFNNPYLVCKLLKIQLQLLLALEDGKTPATAKMAYLRSNLKQIQTQSVQLYPKVAFIQRQFNEITKICQITNPRLYEQARNDNFGLIMNLNQVDNLKGELQHTQNLKSMNTQQSIIKDDIEQLQLKKKRAGEGFSAEVAEIATMRDANTSDIVHSLDKIQNALEMFLHKAINSNDRDWVPPLIQMIQTIQNYVDDNQTASKVHQIQITNSLLSLLMLDDTIDPRVNTACITCLAHIFSFQEAAKSNENKIHIFEPYQTYSQYLLTSKKIDNFAPFFQLMKNSVILDEIQNKLVKASQLQVLAKLFSMSIGSKTALTAGAECLDRYGFSEKIAQIYYEEGIHLIIVDQMPKNLNDSNFTSAFCLLIGTLCRYNEAQAMLSHQKIHKTIIQVLSLYQDDVKVTSNCFYAISGLCFNNLALATEVIESPIVSLMKTLISKQYSQPVLMETISSVISNLTFRNDQNKQILGQEGLIELLLLAYNYYGFQHPELRFKTIKQILRALGNIGFLLVNSTRLIQQKFLSQSVKMLTEKLTNFQEKGELAKYTLDVYANLCSHPEEQNKQNITVILNEGVVDLVLNILKKNVLLGEVVVAGIDTLDGLIQSKQASQMVAERGGIETIVKIVRSHDWNDMVITKSFRLLANLGIVRTNSEYFLKAQVPLSVQEGTRNLKNPNGKLLTYAYKIIHRIAAGQKGQENNLYKKGMIEALTEIFNKKGIFDNHLEMVQLMNRISQPDEALEIVAKKSLSILLQRITEAPKELAPTEQFIREAFYLLERVYQKQNLVNIIDYNASIYVLQNQLRVSSPENKVQIMKCLLALSVSSENARQICIQQYVDKDVKRVAQEQIPQQKVAEQLLNTLSQPGSKMQQSSVPKQQSTVQPPKSEVSKVGFQQNLQLLIEGFNVKLYRFDGSSKPALLQLESGSLSLLARQQDGQVKEKYRIGMKQISYMQFNYEQGSQEWNMSVFGKVSPSLFGKKIMAQNCFTISGSNSQLNLESTQKQQIETVLKSVVNAIQTGLIK